jgi:hypothetical protein
LGSQKCLLSSLTSTQNWLISLLDSCQSTLLDKIEKKKSPDAGNPAIETNKETNSKQIPDKLQMLTSGNANK